MIDASEVLKAMCEKYQAAVNSNDSTIYRKLFATDAIRIPPGSEPERGPDEISESEQKDYDVAKWNIECRPLDVLALNEEWIYGITHIDGKTVTYADETENSFTATKTWLLHKEVSGEWLIKRQMWNLK